jgi:hypothetical protein
MSTQTQDRPLERQTSQTGEATTTAHALNQSLMAEPKESLDIIKQQHSQNQADNQGSGFSGLLGDLWIGAKDEVLHHKARIAESLVAGAALGVAATFASPLIAAGLAVVGAGVGVYEVAEHAGAWISDASTVLNPEGHSSSDIAKANAGIQSFGAGGVDFLAGTVGGAIGSVGTRMALNAAAKSAAAVVDSASSSSSSSSPSSPASSIRSEIDDLFEHTTQNHYDHNIAPPEAQISVSDGSYSVHSDCSGFVSRLLSDRSPSQLDAIHQLQPDRPYPQASTFEKFFESLPPGGTRDGWMKVDSVDKLQPGDVIAWSKPNALANGNTGHVMVVADAPGAVVTETINGQPVRYAPINVFDSSSVRHFAPEILPPHANQTGRDGLGEGVVRLVVDAENKVTGYWEGYLSASNRAITQPSMSPHVSFGRLVPTAPSVPSLPSIPLVPSA